MADVLLLLCAATNLGSPAAALYSSGLLTGAAPRPAAVSASAASGSASASGGAARGRGAVSGGAASGARSGVGDESWRRDEGGDVETKGPARRRDEGGAALRSRGGAASRRGRRGCLVAMGGG